SVMKKLFTKFAILLLAMFIALPAISYSADADVEEMKRNLPKLLGASNVGTEFFLTFHPPWPTAGAKNFIKIYVSSGVETDVKLEVPGKGYLKVQKTIPNDIIEFSLTPGIALPYSKTDRERPLIEQVFSGAGIHITSKDPIIVYGVLRFAYTSDGYLAIPLSGFGKEYIVASWPDPSGGHNAMQWLPSYTSIVTAYDKTSVRVTLGGEDWTETAGGRWPGDVISERMNSADVLTIGTISKHGDLTGTKVRGNLPIGVISGNFCAYIPTGIAACDVLIEMDLPTNTWGTEYHVTPIFSRFKNSFIRVFAKENDTQIYRDGQALGLIPKAGGLHGEGWLEYRAAEGDPIPVVISGNKPISVTQYNPGIQDDAANDTDPFQMILTPLEQYQEEIVFNTPGIRGGFGFDNNFINVVYEATEYGTIPDDLLFAEVKDGKFEWIQFNNMEANPGDEFQVKINNKRYFSKTIRLNHDGVYKIRAKAPFTAYAYGNSWCDTYGFPTSVALGDLSIPDTVAPDPEWEIDCFGNVDGKVTDMPDEAEYRSNLSLIYMASQLSYNYIFEYGRIIAGETRKTDWSLEVIDKQQEARAVLVFSDRRGNDTTIVIDFYPTLISIHEDEYNFGRLAVGESAEHTFWVINDSKVGDLNLTQLKLLFGTQGFEITENPIVTIVPPLDSVSFKVKFTATEEGMYEDSIGVGDPCFFWYKAYVQANVGAPRIVVGRYDFGSVNVDDSKYGIVTVQNIGSSALEIYSYTGPELKPVYEVLDWMAFEEYGEDPTDEKPWIIKPGVEQIFEVKFTPDAEGIFLDSVVFTSNTDRPTDTYIDSVGELTGTGIQAYLIANGYDWLRRRIDRPGTFDIAPYPVEAPDKVIFLENSGTTPVMIKNLKIS
ncbi:MAG: choice-of-anchor D domain-containing protein, partial [Candidatus Kapabacteria bacterium]|nr:choice-of-anchor D domain-containing protein [Candidatus Kapabacteria bacterium]